VILVIFGGSFNSAEATLSFLKKLFGGKSGEPVQRTRVCVECGMPVANHKDWCSILRGQQEMELRAASK
jgi:hypothetical protein